ncbi:hypothetical protein F2Q69_00021141 [Brassica cretica]|uniref:Uncharacterized protein n=1 Tax=Brassica cretica TaxID=69181 RepID=A0A8S9QCK0_BRACR|nr:hypothetical protein F2Q69_00021141 [Brassica cretica]
MDFDFWGSDGSAAGSAFLVPPVFPLIHSGIGLECFVDVAAQCRFCPIRCSLSFGGSCHAAGVVVSFLLCSVQIEHLGCPECRTDRYSEGSTFPLTDRGVFDFFLERLQLDALRVPSQPGLVVPIGGIRCVWVVPVASLAHVDPVGMVSVPESDPIGLMSLTLEGVVPTVWLGSIVALRKLRSVS